MQASVGLVCITFALGYLAALLDLPSKIIGFLHGFSKIHFRGWMIVLSSCFVLVGGFWAIYKSLRSIVVAERVRFWKENGDDSERTDGRRSLVMTSDFKLSRNSFAYELFNPSLVNRLAASQNIS